MHFNFLMAKIVSILIILSLGLIFGLWPVLTKIKDHRQKFLFCGEAFAGGVFLGAGLIHLLPDASACFQHIGINSSYPWAFAIAAASILVLRLIEEGVVHFFKRESQCCAYHIWMAYLLAILLSVHSVLEGVALGVEIEMATLLVLLMAIVAHKGAESFALGVKMRQSGLPKKSAIRLLILFALMTPIGIAFGSFLTTFLTGRAGELAQAIFMAIAAGTFIYIAAFDNHHDDGEEIDSSNRGNDRARRGNDEARDNSGVPKSDTHAAISVSAKLFFFSSGLILMAAVAAWL